MNREKIIEVFSDKEFVMQLLEIEDMEEARAFIAEKGIELTVEEVTEMRDQVVKKISDGSIQDMEIDDEDLENVTGGFLGVAIAYLVATIVLVSLGMAVGIDGMTRRRTIRW